MFARPFPGAVALVAAPVVALAGTLLQPTLSDSPADQVAALSDHRGAMIGAMTLNGIAVVLLIAGTIWLAFAIAPRSPRLALAGGVLGVLGSLVVLFESGVAAAAPAIVSGLGPAQATAALQSIHSSTAASGLEPLSLAGDVGLALLGLALVKLGAPRSGAAAIAIGAFAEGAGFAIGTKGAVLTGFALLFVGLAYALRAVVARRESQLGTGLPVRVSG
jgi:hypothetical protein